VLHLWEKRGVFHSEHVWRIYIYDTINGELLLLYLESSMREFLLTGGCGRFMNWKRRVFGFLLFVLVGSIVSGCNPSTHVHKSPTNDVSTPPKDGTIASMTKVTLSKGELSPYIKLYELFYWSHGLKVEAYLTVPSNPGKYPLLVGLHGGAGWRTESSSGLGYTPKQVAALANASVVMLYPEYEGYMNSQGTVHGLKNDTLDVLNAISAVKSMGEVKANDTYLLGNSLGGGLALMTAAADHDVKAVVCVSPFVGLNDFVPWAKANAKSDSIFYTQLLEVEASYGDAVRSSTYNDRSPDIQGIDSPVLLLQGTADQHVAWQTVQTFADQMKAAHKTVKFVLYNGGRHGLHTVPYELESSNEINSWFEKYGLNILL